MNIIGSDTLRFVSLPKNGSTSIKQLVKRHDFIKGWSLNSEDFDNVHSEIFNPDDLFDEKITFIFPFRYPIERNISGLLENLSAEARDIENNEDLKSFIKSKYTNSKFSTNLTYDDNLIMYHFIKNLINPSKSATILFVFLKKISNPEFIKFCTTIDSRFENCFIEKVNTVEENSIKKNIIQTFKELSSSSPINSFDLKEVSNWENGMHIRFEKRLFNYIIDSKYFINI